VPTDQRLKVGSLRKQVSKQIKRPSIVTLASLQLAGRGASWRRVAR
jgi:hypothetical protein